MGKWVKATINDKEALGRLIEPRLRIVHDITQLPMTVSQVVKLAHENGLARLSDSMVRNYLAAKGIVPKRQRRPPAGAIAPPPPVVVAQPEPLTLPRRMSLQDKFDILLAEVRTIKADVETIKRAIPAQGSLALRVIK